MLVIYQKKSSFIIALVTLIAVLFSCQGISLMKLAPPNHSATASYACCDDVSDHHNLGSHVDTIAAYLPSAQNNIGILLGGLILLTLIYRRDQNHNGLSYVRAMRRRYGSFTPLNYFSSLFREGVLHAKTF